MPTLFSQLDGNGSIMYVLELSDIIYFLFDKLNGSVMINNQQS